MSLEMWKTVWTVVLVVSIAVFAGMAVWVIIGGFGDIKRLLTRLDDSHRDGDSSAPC